jgi:hypothetical protein
LNESAVLRPHARSAVSFVLTGGRASPSHARVEELTVRDRMIVDAVTVLRGRQEQLPRRATRQPNRLPRQVRLIRVPSLEGERCQRRTGIAMSLRKDEEALKPDDPLQHLRAQTDRRFAATPKLALGDMER